MASESAHESGKSSGLYRRGGTVIITGANGSLALSFVEYLLTNYPLCCALFAVRDDSESDPNTKKLRKIVSRYPFAKVSIEALDLASLSNVRSFANNVAARISTGRIPPISAIVCNAFAWSLTDIKYSKDGYDLGFQVSHLSHFVLVLKLLNSMNKESGRIVLLGSEAHDSKNKNSFNTLGAGFPEDLEEVIKPTPDKKGEEMSRGFQRYSNAKLANVMFMHSLNKKLQQSVPLRNITVTAMDPGGMPTSRAFKDVPLAFRAAMYIVGHFVLPLAQYATNAINTTKTSGRDLVVLSVDPKYAGVRGYFLGQKLMNSSIESQDDETQEKIWMACEKWSSFEQSESILKK